ncbi:MAG: YlmC/YmxH family sporulation protein [Bacillales bacterium]|jgi:YlmC/YmxH family sporulation protein|nr:YlmC/YmxH family sporulation protein [Bacillales bacterium]
MVKISELQNKEILNLYNGAVLGQITDIDINPNSGLILSVQVSTAKLFSFFSGEVNFEITWQDIKKIGTDFIFVDDAKFSAKL